jgi:hypothetical protein
MPYLTTGSTELKAVNQILASVGQAPVTTLTTEETFVVSEVSRFTGSISGTTLTTETDNIPVGTYIGGTGVTDGTSIAVAGTEASPATDPVTYEYTLNISQTVAERTLTRSEVTTRVETQTNPDVAIALNTLREVSREVQAEGWSYNVEFDYKITPDSNNEIRIADDVLQMDLNQGYPENIEKDAVFRGGKLYDKKAHSYKWTAETVYVDIVWYFDWESIPQPIQAHIVARAAAIVSSRIIGDANQYQILQQKEAVTRSQALEYECNQGDYSFFGSPSHGNFYRPYKPFHTLQR